MATNGKALFNDPAQLTFKDLKPGDFFKFYPGEGGSKGIKGLKGDWTNLEDGAHCNLSPTAYDHFPVERISLVLEK